MLNDATSTCNPDKRVLTSGPICYYVQKDIFLQHTVFVALFSSFFLSFVRYFYEMLIIPLYGLLYIGYAYRKSMGVEICHLTL